MKNWILIACSTLALTAAAFAQAPPLGPPPGGPHGRFGHGPGFGPGGPGFGPHEGKVVTGKPYSATFTSQFTQTLANNGTISHSDNGSVARDSSGRTYEQMTVTGGPLGSANGPTQVIFITDPVKGVRYTLYPAKNIAIESPFHPHTGGDHPPNNGGEKSNPNVTVTKTTAPYSGLTNPVDVTTIVRNIPANTMGNSVALSSTTTVDYSPDLQIVVATSRSDMRFGTENYALTITSLAEPDASLFTVPASYTIQQAQHGRRGFGGPPQN